MSLHQASRIATAALEASSRAEILHLFDDWDSGRESGNTIHWRLQAVVREAYRTSAAIARGVAQQSSDLPDWQSHEVFNTDYLQALLVDVRKNVRDYKAGNLSRDSAVLRIQHSAGVAAQRGYTDQTIASYTELQDFGFELRKYWVANFVNNDPCPACRSLHGSWVGLHEDFKAETSTGIYRDLIGPPRHPRCQCRLYVFIVSLENAFEHPNFENPQDSPQMMSVADVQKMPESLFKSIRNSLRAVLRFLRGS